MPSPKKRQPVSRKAVSESSRLLPVSRLLIDLTALVLLYLILHLEWKVF